MPNWKAIERGREAAQERARTARASEQASDQGTATAAQHAGPIELTYTAGGAIELFTPTPSPAPAHAAPTIAPVTSAAPQEQKNWFEQAIDWVKDQIRPHSEPTDENAIRNEQTSLSAMGLYVSEGHKYYADGIAGGLTEHARKLRDDEDYSLRYLEERISNKSFLGSISDGNHEKEVLMLQAALNRSRGLNGLEPLSVDGILGAETLAGLELYKNDFEVTPQDFVERASGFVQDLVAPRPTLQLEREDARLEEPLTSRQERVTSIMGAAAERFNVPPELMVGIWHHETRFSCSGLESSTGCQGDWQFERATMRNVVRLYGDDMEDVLRESGHDRLADAVADVQRRALHGRVTNAELDAFRNSPEISTVAAAALMRDNAGTLRLGDTIDRNEYGLIYAGYNGGPENARAMRDGRAITDESFLRSNTVGNVARTHTAQRDHYDRAMTEGIEEGQNMLLATRIGERDRDVTPRAAESFQAPALVRDEGPEGAAARVQLTNRFDAGALGKDFGDMVVNGLKDIVRTITGQGPSLTA